MYSVLSLQHELSRKAISELQSLYNTSYRYGSIITTICKFNKSHFILVLDHGYPANNLCFVHRPSQWRHY